MSLNGLFDEVGQTPSKDDVRDRQPAAGLESPKGLPEGFILVRNQVDDTVGDDGIHRTVLNREYLNLPSTELHIGVSSLPGIGCRPLQHLPGHIHTYDLTFFTHCQGGQEAVKASPRSQVQHRLTLFQASHGHGIAAAEPQVGAFRHRLHLLIGVSYLPAYLLRLG